MKALVTGGGGFLGGAIIRQLLVRGDTVRSISRGDYPALREQGVETFQGDLADADSLDTAAQGCDVIFHVAARPGVWGPHELYHRANVIATENVIAACERYGVSRLVYTSSPSITFSGKDQEGIDESVPITPEPLTSYLQTKAEGERLALAANGNTLSTTALRPHLIWGPGDTQLIPRVVRLANSGKLRLVGSGRKLVDAVYVDNAAQAHILAADRLAPDAACAGKAYYITNDEPWPMADVLNGILKAAGAPELTKKVPAGAAYALGAVLEFIYKTLGKEDEPPMTRFVALQLATAHWYNVSAAKRDLGYVPLVSMAEGLERLAADFRD
jgi:nucleoside-diphosphate-sugar epimerase